MRLKLYLITLSILTGAGWLWFTLAAGPYYRPYYENFLTDNLRLIVLSILYLLSVTAFFYLAIIPSLRPDHLLRPAIGGGLLGVVGGAANFWTNLTSRHWPLWFIILEIIWWIVILAATAEFVVWLGRKWEKS